MKKIMLIGSGGTGKSTLARQIGQMLAIEVIHLDTLMWRSNWEIIYKDEQIAIQQKLVRKDEWIIDGNYGGTMDIRLREADTVIFFDYSRYLCLYRALKRMIQYRNKSRPDMVEGNNERLDYAFLKWIWAYPKTKRPVILQTLTKLSEEKNVVILGTPKEAKDYIKKLDMQLTEN